MPATRSGRPGRRATATATIGPAADRFLAERGLAPTTRRAYRSTLQAVVDAFGPNCRISDIDIDELAAVTVERWGHTAPASWNRHLATLRSFFAWCGRQGWTSTDPTVGIDRRSVPAHDTRVIAYSDLEALWSRRDVALREKLLWRMLYETAARANEILNLDVDDLDPANKQATIISKGGARAVVHWQSGTARLLPNYLKARTRGPLFL
ncbi:MAG: tyrosine-type recombinase/integrase [Acidimicrobiales bacterium]